MMTGTLWFLIFTGLSGTLCAIFGKDVYVMTPKTWLEARKHCRENYIDLSLIANRGDVDLSSIENQDDDDHPSIEKRDVDDQDSNSSDDDDDDDSNDDDDDNDNSHNDDDNDDNDNSHNDDDDDGSDDNNDNEDNEATKTIWTGLNIDANDTENGSGGTHVLSSLLGNQDKNRNCMVIDKDGLHAADCEAKFPFYCYRSSLVLVKENKTWEEAMEGCRSMDMELVSLPSESGLVEVLHVGRTAQTGHVWTGLRYFADSWLWTDGTIEKYQPWSQGNKPNCPAWTHHCAALSLEGQSLDSWDCADQLNYICYKKK